MRFSVLPLNQQGSLRGTYWTGSEPVLKLMRKREANSGLPTRRYAECANPTFKLVGNLKKQNKLRGLSSRTNYTGRTTAACLRS
jgi:hypothetical protein